MELVIAEEAELRSPPPINLAILLLNDSANDDFKSMTSLGIVLGFSSGALGYSSISTGAGSLNRGVWGLIPIKALNLLYIPSASL